MTQPTAILSVYDKTGLIELAKGLAAKNVRLLGSGGTARAVREAGIEIGDVSDITKAPEMLQGRVKTLHPGIHGGLLARRDVPAHMAALAQHGVLHGQRLAANQLGQQRIRVVDTRITQRRAQCR